MKIKTLRSNLLRNEELFQFQTELLAQLRNNATVKDGLGPVLYGECNRLFAAADAALQAGRKSAYTEVLAEQDALRDRHYGSLRESLELGTRHFDSAKHAPAKRLLVVLDKYRRDIRTGSYDEETAALTNLVEDLQAAPASDDINTLGLTGWVSALDSANKQFEASLRARDAETAAQSSAIPETMTSLRHGIITNLRDVFEKINALALTATDPVALTAINAFIVLLNTLIDRYDREAAHHHHRHPSPPTPPLPPTPPNQ
ncbi:MAG: DUF6261 family protein [Opitutaceae bacterium]|jgi:hypothetical protein|nr:DUF6261 family protein [Opitutaceae bacterium]